MAMSNKASCFLVAGAAIVVLWYFTYSETEKQAPMNNVPVTTAFNGMLDSCTAQEFFRPHQVTENQELGFMRHRYPTVTGGNVSTLIHQGMSALKRTPPQSEMWFKRPPGEVMF